MYVQTGQTLGTIQVELDISLFGLKAQPRVSTVVPGTHCIVFVQLEI
jgi:hypothetical protein